MIVQKSIMTKIKHTITLLFLVFFGEITHAAVYDPADLSQAYFYLNQIRERAEMTEFSQNPQLEAAAFNHANYLADNFMIGHYEVEETPGFTGVEARDRAIFTGYRSSSVSENISSGNDSGIKSIDSLMGAIYHRFGFLGFGKNEVGIGIGKVSEPNSYSVYVYNMGNVGLNALCEGTAFSGFGRYYYNVCEPDIKIDASEFENVENSVQSNNPNIVLWPTDGDNDVPPAFFEESPDPLPDYSVSGYPISIQFNPSIFTDVNVTEFKLYRDSDNLEIQLTRLLTQSSDPNGKFSALQYALFPLERLDWNTAYRAEAGYTTSSGTNLLIWRFKTRSLDVPLYTVQSEGEVLSIPPTTSALAVYISPTAGFSEINRISYRYSGGLTLETDFIDGNTLRIDLFGNVGDKATFTLTDATLGGERNFIIKIMADAVEPTTIVTEVVEPIGTTTPEVIDKPEVCEPVTLSSELKLHIPVFKFIPVPDQPPIMYWADLKYMDNLQFEVIEYGLAVNVVETCELATLSSEFNLRIPTLQYTPAPDKMPWIMQADLKFVAGDTLIFQMIKLSLIVSQ